MCDICDKLNSERAKEELVTLGKEVMKKLNENKCTCEINSNSIIVNKDCSQHGHKDFQY